MAFQVEKFRQAMRFDGARPNLFECRIPNVNGITNSKDTFMFKAAQLPQSTVGVVPVPYFGREVRFAGNRTFTEWTVTVLNDEDFRVRDIFETWHRRLNDNEFNLRAANKVSSADYAHDALVTQFAKSGAPIRTYRFVGMFPTDITAIDLDWGSNDAIEEFTVTFTFQYWELVKSDTDVAGATTTSQDGGGAPAGPL